MPLADAALADKMAKALQSKDGATKQIKDTAKAFVETVKAGIFNHPVVNGTAGAPGGPLAAGAAEGGVILLPSAAALPAQLASALGGPPTPEILGFANGFATHIQTGLVSFKPGGITGTCGHSPTAPGPVLAMGQNGQIMGLNDAALAQLWVTAFKGDSDIIKDLAKAVVEYFAKETMGSYAMGSVSGLAPPGGGPIVAVGVGGTFS